MPRNRSARISALLISAVVLAAAVIHLTGDDPAPAPPGDQSPAIPEQVKVDGPDSDAKRDDTVPLSEQAENVGQDFVDDPKDLEPQLPGKAPLEGTAPQVAENVIPAPLAADQIVGCRTRFFGVNFSQRAFGPAGVLAVGLHYTAGPDLPGTRSEVDGLTAFGNRASSRVSWAFNLDKDGNCDYNVPLRLKAWTIGDLNSQTINFEVAGRGESPYLRDAGYDKLAVIWRQIKTAYPQIKLRLGAVSNCRVTRSGWITHWMGGPCSGGHTDIRPHDIAAVIRQVQLRLDTGRPNTRGERRACRQLARARSKVRAGGSWQDRVVNERGEPGPRHRFANRRKTFLKQRDVRQRRYCNGR